MQDLDCDDLDQPCASDTPESSEVFEYDQTACSEAECGRGMCGGIHGEGKRKRDELIHNANKAELQRINREEALDADGRRRKVAAQMQKTMTLERYCSVAKVSKLCGGTEKCCKNRCVEVRVCFYETKSLNFTYWFCLLNMLVEQAN